MLARNKWMAGEVNPRARELENTPEYPTFSQSMGQMFLGGFADRARRMMNRRSSRRPSRQRPRPRQPTLIPWSVTIPEPSLRTMFPSNLSGCCHCEALAPWQSRPRARNRPPNDFPYSNEIAALRSANDRFERVSPIM